MTEDVQEILQRRFGRRTLIRGGVLGGVGLATAAVIGCDNDDDGDGSASGGSGGGTPAKAVHLNIASQGHPPNLDPDSTAATSFNFWATYDTMTRLTPEADVIPHLAKEWEYNEGNGEWVFKLEEAEWSDGTKFTADDVKFSHDWYKDPANESRLISRVGTFESARVIDDQTIAIKTEGTGDPILPRRSTFVLIKPRHIFEDPSKGRDFQAENAIGTGAYTVTNWVRDSKIELAASPSSWFGNSGITSVTDFSILERTTRTAALETGDVDWADTPSIQDTDRIRGFGDGAEVGNPPSDSQQGWDIRYFDGPTADPRVRLAINHALDIQAQVDVIFLGFSRPMKGQITTVATFGHNPNLEPYGFDQDKARELLKDAGFPNGFDAGIEFRQNDAEQKAFSESAIGDINAVGIKTDNIPVETNVWRDGLYGNKERATLHWSPWSAFAYEASFAMQWYVKDNPGKFYDNPAFESAFDAALLEFDDEKRRDLYHAASAAMNEDTPAAWVLENVRLMAWYKNKITYSPRRNPTIAFDSVVPV
jgi:peptide/nickel transport system substrate-binding protein